MKSIKSFVNQLVVLSSIILLSFPVSDSLFGGVSENGPCFQTIDFMIQLDSDFSKHFNNMLNRRRLMRMPPANHTAEDRLDLRTNFYQEFKNAIKGIDNVQEFFVFMQYLQANHSSGAKKISLMNLEIFEHGDTITINALDKINWKSFINRVKKQFSDVDKTKCKNILTEILPSVSNNKKRTEIQEIISSL